MSYLRIFITLIIGILNLKYISGQYLPNSPCPEVFTYETSNNEIAGLIKVDNLQINDMNVVTVNFTNNGGRGQQSLEVVQSRQDIFNNIKNRLPVYYKVKFMNVLEIPEVILITSNGYIICQNPNVYPGGYSTTTHYLKLQEQKYYNVIDMTTPNGNVLYTLNNILPNAEVSYFDEAIQPQDKQQQYHITYSQPIQSNNHKISQNNQGINLQQQRRGSKPALQQNLQQQQKPASQSSYDRNQDTLSFCGRTEVVAVQLIIDGDKLEPGSWPWLVGLFNKISNSYNCGGSLVSHKTILTAAHCFNNGQNPKDYLVGIGIYDLSKIREPGSVYSKILEIIMHPDYSTAETASFSDIAMITLEQFISYTPRIRPICLWNDSDDLSYVVDKNAMVAGWGLTSSSKTSNIPNIVETQIVSDSVCLRANNAFPQITSTTTFCAGLRNGRGPCKGDSGSGLMIKHNGVWVLRGIVSQSLAHQTKVCDLSDYVVYTDAAKFKNWIRVHMTD